MTVVPMSIQMYVGITGLGRLRVTSCC